MSMKRGAIALTAAAVGLAIVAAAYARPDGVRAVQTASGAQAIACRGTLTLGMMAPITGPAASIGDDQLHWAQFYFTQWNKKHRLKFKLQQGDTQLDPSKASVVAQQFALNSKMPSV